MKKFSFFAIIFLMLFFVCGTAAMAGGEYNTIVQYGADPMREISISWTTDDLISEIRINGIPAASESEKLWEGAYRHTVRLLDLLPDTTYEYSLEGESGCFKTAAEGNTSFIFTGDVQYKEEKETTYAEWGKFLKRALSDTGADFVLSCGDYVNIPRLKSDWDAFLSNTSAALNGTPFMTAVGNHETVAVPDMYLRLFGLPENGPQGLKEEFYSFDSGECHITVLNTSLFMPERERMLGGEAWRALVEKANKWIEADLSGSNKKWKLISMHHPAYSVGDDDALYQLIRENWTPLFEEFGVDIVFCGHEHLYMRTNIINGVVYMMANSGYKTYDYELLSAQDYIAKLNDGSPVYISVNANAEALSIKAVDGGGALVDSYQKRKYADGWNKIDGNWYYYYDSQPLIGEQTLEGYRRGGGTGENDYLFSETGILVTGFVKSEDGWVYYGEAGATPLTSSLGQKLKDCYVKNPESGYVSASESFARKNKKTLNYYYYFDTQGIMLTGWHGPSEENFAGAWRYLGENGVSPKTSRLGRRATNGAQYCLGNTGEKNMYMFSQTGGMRIGWRNINGSQTYFNEYGINPTTDLLGAALWSKGQK